MFATARTALTSKLTYANVASTLALVLALGTGTAYAANTVRSSDIVNGQVKTPDLANGAVGPAKIKPDAVGTSSILDDSILGADLTDNSIGSSQLVFDSVGASEIADGSIDGGEIINQSIGSADLATNAITADELTNNVVTGAKVASNSLTTADLAGTDALGAISLGAGSVPDGRCKSYNITVGDAQSDEGIVISARATLPSGMFIYGVEVPTAGHAIMAVCNLSGAAMPALTNFPIRAITFG